MSAETSTSADASAGGVGEHDPRALAAEAFGTLVLVFSEVDLAAERRHGEFLLSQRARLRAAADLSDGGLALAAFEMAEAAGIGITLDSTDIALLFGEDQARYLVAAAPAQAAEIMAAASDSGIPIANPGRFGGDQVDLGGDSAPLSALSDLYRGSFVQRVGLDH